MFFKKKAEEAAPAEPKRADPAPTGAAALSSEVSEVGGAGSAAAAPSPSGSNPLAAASVATPKTESAPEISSGAPSPEALAALDPARQAQEREQARVFGELALLMTRDPQLRSMRLQELEWLLIPAIVNGRSVVVRAVVEVKDEKRPLLGGALWASVSDEISQRFETAVSEKGPLKISPNEWRSGENLWLLAVLGHPILDPKIVEHLEAEVFKGRPYKRFRPPLQVKQAETSDAAG